MSDFNFGGDELPEDLAAAIRKSWSAPQETPLIPEGRSFTPLGNVNNAGSDSPIGTPTISDTNLTGMSNQNETLPLVPNNSTSVNGDTPVNIVSGDGNTANEGNVMEGTMESLTNGINSMKQPDYQLFKHHYSISENARESVSDILHELDIESSESPSPNELMQNIDSNMQQQQQEQQSQFFQQPTLRNPFSSNSSRSASNNQSNQFDSNEINPRNVNYNNMNPTSNTSSRSSSNNNNNNNNYDRARIPNRMTTRRGSIQDVQWIRQLLNPRSSFSGPSQTEMSTNDPFLQQRYQRGIGSLVPPLPSLSVNSSTGSSRSSDSIPEITKCWVTVLKDDSIESVKSMIVLYYSLSVTNSKFPMYVLYDPKLDVSQLMKYKINTVPIRKEYFQDMGKANMDNEQYQELFNKNWFILSLFVTFINSSYELVCYITPSSMIIDNIDELLEDPNINNEIDNETCVLLTNSMTASNDNDNEPQLIIFKPNQEVAMCIKEFFTLYGDDNERLIKINKLLQTSDYQVLKELFGETWGIISSDGYVNVLEPNEESLNINNFIVTNDGTNEPRQIAKILDFKKIKPWNMKLSSSTDNGNGNVINKWNEIWLEFWNTYKNV